MAKLTYLTAMLLIVAAPAYAGQIWDCTVRKSDVPPAIGNHSIFIVEGDDLRTTTGPVDITVPELHIPAATFHYRILENNDVGLVAVTTQARNDKDVGPVVAAETIVIDKANGRFHEGIVGNSGLSDMASGSCKLK
jgi:hypothetical protein